MNRNNQKPADSAGNSSMSQKQKQMLVEFVKKNPLLISGKQRNNFTNKDSENLWKEISSLLNSSPGSHKDWKGWRKTWQDLKQRVKSKEGKNKKSYTGTGGGPFSGEILTTTEEDIFGLLNNVSIEGHDGVPVPNITFEYDDVDVTIQESLAAENVDIYDIKDISSSSTVLASEEGNVNLEEKIGESENVLNVAEGQKEKNVTKKKTKFPKCHMNFVNSANAATAYQENLEKKISMKEEYYKKKIEILQKNSETKERKVLALEKIGSALEKFNSNL